MATNIASLFTAPEDILAAQQQQNLQRQAAISQQGQGFGVFAPLYQAGLRNIDTAAQALFPTQDPRLQRATMIQGVLSKYQGQDMTDPDVLNSMSSEFAGMGLAREAMTLAQDARAAKREAEKMGLERDRLAVAQGQLSVAQEQERRAKYKDNPYLMIEDAAAMAEDDPRRNALIQGATDAIGKAETDRRVKEAQIAHYKAQAQAQGGGKISSTFVSETEDGKIVPLTDLNGRLYTPECKAATNVRMARESDLAALLRTQPGGAGGAAQDTTQAQAAAALERRRKEEERKKRSTGSNVSAPDLNMLP